MTPEEAKFRELRHRAYRLGKNLISILEQMGCLTENSDTITLSKETQREMLFQIAGRDKLPELEILIKKKEAEILAQIGHIGDPCEYCHLPMIEVKPGPCPVRKKMVQT